MRKTSDLSKTPLPMGRNALCGFRATHRKRAKFDSNAFRIVFGCRDAFRQRSEGPQSRPGGAFGPPQAARDPPEARQGRPGASQERSWGAPGASRGRPGASLERPRIDPRRSGGPRIDFSSFLRRFSIDFSSDFDRFWCGFDARAACLRAWHFRSSLVGTMFVRRTALRSSDKRKTKRACFAPVLRVARPAWTRDLHAAPHNLRPSD